jgi:hypothetical protein
VCVGQVDQRISVDPTTGNRTRRWNAAMFAKEADAIKHLMDDSKTLSSAWGVINSTHTLLVMKFMGRTVDVIAIG